MSRFKRVARAIAALAVIGVIAAMLSNASTDMRAVKKNPLSDVLGGKTQPTAGAGASPQAPQTQTQTGGQAAWTKAGPGRTETGLTRVRFSIDTSAAWVNFVLEQATIRAIRVAGTTGELKVTGLGPTLAASGKGTADIDTVLEIPPNAKPNLRMCKNHLGPATVTLTRLNDGSAPILSLVNDGTSPNTPKDCINQKVSQVSRPDLMGATRFPARVDARHLVLAHYYPWYDAENLKNNYGDNPSGPVNTNDPADVAKMIDLAVAHGVDGFVIEYMGTPAHEPRIEMVYASAERYEGFLTALNLDLLVLHKTSGLGPAVLDAALAKVADRAGAKSQLKVGGEPVVFLYGARMVVPQEWQAALDRLRASRGVSPFVVGDEPALPTAGRYDYNTNTVATNPELLTWGLQRLTQHRAIPGLNGSAGSIWAAPVSPGYDDTRLGRPKPIKVDRADGVRYATTWTAALNSLPDWIVITTWNEFFEQTHIMSGTASGMKYLQQTAQNAAIFHAQG